ncbi:MAG TPA: MgtC/SapB family protein [Spongiibacteraceae bacterium]|nr:MgtC/SapB family protein [Spongiibacteraceae bacterium]HUH36732.1 MgtC/SapB family protein [Spongiibacteraceae bacterium]
MLSTLADINWIIVATHFGHLLAAYILAIPIAWNREQSERSAGLRTFPIVALASCAFMLIAIDVFDEAVAQSRVFEGIVTGIGFIGGGAILKNTDRVRGTATAASLWGTGAIGIAVAWQRLEIALVLCVLIFLTLFTFRHFKKPEARDSRAG